MMLSCKRTATQQARAKSSQLTSFVSGLKNVDNTKCPKLQPYVPINSLNLQWDFTQLIVSYESRLYHHPIWMLRTWRSLDPYSTPFHSFLNVVLIVVARSYLLNRLRSEIILVFTLGFFLNSRSYSIHITV